jgi:hypothetical protein
MTAATAQACNPTEIASAVEEIFNDVRVRESGPEGKSRAGCGATATANTNL